MLIKKQIKNEVGLIMDDFLEHYHVPNHSHRK